MKGKPMWGIVPAAGAGSRMQPLAFSKELLPVGSRLDRGIERPRAVSEYLVERMIVAGATRICFVISPGKTDIIEYFGGQIGPAHLSYVVQPEPAGLCDAIFRALPMIPQDEPVIVGLPDTIWFPEDGLRALPDDVLSFLLFPVERPEFFDAVLTDDEGNVREIRVKKGDPGSHWIWGAFKMPGAVLRELHELWSGRSPRDEYFGTLVNAYLANGGRAVGVRRGEAYVDVGTLNGYREAIDVLRTGPPYGAVSERGIAGAHGRNRPAGSAPERPADPDRDRGTPRRFPSDEMPPQRGTPRTYTPDEIRRRVRELGLWFHNMNLNGVQTAPDHFLGDFPTIKWSAFRDSIPADLRGKTVLDIGCNAGFYSIEMKRRGASRVLGIDSDPEYLAQARFAAEVLGADVEYREMSVYDVPALGERFDLVLFLGVLYHLRHPMLALDLLAEHVVKDLLVFQTLMRGSLEPAVVDNDYPFAELDVFDDPHYPKLHLVERCYAGDPTNWWIPNRACAEGMLRSAGFQILESPEPEVFVCRIAGPKQAGEDAIGTAAATGRCIL